MTYLDILVPLGIAYAATSYLVFGVGLLCMKRGTVNWMHRLGFVLAPLAFAYYLIEKLWNGGSAK